MDERETMLVTAVLHAKPKRVQACMLIYPTQNREMIHSRAPEILRRGPREEDGDVSGFPVHTVGYYILS